MTHSNKVRDTVSFVVLLDSLARKHGCRVRVQFYAEAEYIIIGGDSVRAYCHVYWGAL